MPRLIVFDCDGTLVDSQHTIAAATAHAFSANGLAVPPRSRLLRYVGLSLAEAMAALTRGSCTDPDTVARLVATYRAAFHELRQRPGAADPMYPGAREAIASLCAQEGVLLGLATGKSRRGVNAFLEREGLCGVFVTIQTADDAPSKPHPAMLHQAMNETGARAENTVMIGDTSYDMAMARAAKARGIGVAWGYHSSEDMTRAGASVVAQDFGALLSLLSPARNVAVA
jgi:phosphoglycolate phosphatase